MNNLVSQKGAIGSILGGWSELQNYGSEGEFLASIGIDPENNLENTRASGVIAPTIYSKATNGQITAAPMWISGSNTSTGIYVLDFNGSLVAYSATLTGEVGLGNPNSGAGKGNGMAVWNDYVYCALNTTIARLGRISQTAPAFTADYWVSGLSMSALTDSEYPATRDVTYPNHFLYPHTDGRMYVLDYDGNGRVHSFATDDDGTNGSARFNDLTLPPGMMPMAAAPYGTDIAIACTPAALFATGSTPRSVSAIVAFWDGIPTHNPYLFVPVNAPMATAIHNKNGELFVIAGNIDTDVRVLRYAGGYSFETMAIIDEGSPPPAGAIDSYGNMLCWGGSISYPETAASVFSLGYRSGKLPSGAVQNIARTTATGSLPIVSSLRFLQQSRTPAIGWRDQAPAYGIDKIGSGTFNSLIRTTPVNIGKPFRLRRLTIPLSKQVQSGVTIVPTIYVDNETSNTALTTINSTNFTSSELIIDYQDLDVQGKYNFSIQFAFTGTLEVGILPPITYEYEYID